MNEKISNGIIRETDCIGIHTGKKDKALIPHIVARVPLFVATKAPNERSEEGITFNCTNDFHDLIKIKTLRRLYCDLDLSVFLGVIALAQKSGISEYQLGSRSFFLSTFPISELYELTRTTSKNSHRIYEALEAVGGTNLTIQFGEKRPDNVKKWESKPFWDLEIVSRRGRLGNLLDFNLNRFIVPNPDKYLFANVVQLQELKKPLSKAIFWYLLCRTHRRRTIQEWKERLGITESKIKRWKENTLIPALEELEAIGFQWDENEDGIYISRKTPKSLKTCT